MHNSDIVEIIWQRFSNAELSRYLTDLKVQFHHLPQNYREVLQDIAIDCLEILEWTNGLIFGQKISVEYQLGHPDGILLGYCEEASR